MENSLIYILKKLLKLNRISVDAKELEFQLLSHPSYPSLNSITGVLDHFKVENAALEIPNNIDSYNALPGSFIAYIKNNTLDELALVVKKDKSVKIILGKKELDDITVEEFLTIWTGIIIAVEKDETQIGGRKEFTMFSSKTLNVFMLVFLTSLFILTLPDLFQSIHFLLSFLGFAIAIVIVKHEIGLHSIIADKFCSSNIKRVDCNEVLESKGSNFFGLIKLSDVGIIYFGSLIIAWLILGITKVSYSPILIISICAIPFTFYSIIYQYFIVKKWCLLCLSVLAVLWLQAGAIFFTKLTFYPVDFNSSNLGVIGLTFILSIGLWQFISPKLKIEQVHKKLNIEHHKFKRNYTIYRSLNLNNSYIDTSIANAGEIIFGNSKSKVNIVVITNPMCGYCKDAHQLVSQLISINNPELSITIRFNVNQNFNALDTKIALGLLKLYHEQGEGECIKEMDKVFDKNRKSPQLNDFTESIDEKYIDVLKKEKDWCIKNGLNFTPEILVNGYSFPQEYNRTDLIYFIDDIIEEEQYKKEKSREIEYINSI